MKGCVFIGVQVRLGDGTVLRKALEPSSTLSDVCQYVISVRPRLTHIQLVQVSVSIRTNTIMHVCGMYVYYEVSVRVCMRTCTCIVCL